MNRSATSMAAFAERLANAAISPDHVLLVLQGHIGAANGVTACALVRALVIDHTPADERRLRSVIEHLRREGHAICADPGHGYFMAANESDLDATCEFLYGRALTSLQQVAAMKKVAMPDLRGQLRLPLVDASTGSANESASEVSHA